MKTKLKRRFLVIGGLLAMVIPLAAVAHATGCCPLCALGCCPFC